ncbi:MAG: prepilin peptidase [Candidatus Aenigmarchaeota archaeon]|nr:prepilin peptidase [Candidatus Aenigmarchaeota archaeon]
MLEYIIYSLITVGIVGSGIAGYFDLKTTEIPDEIPVIMIIIGLILRGAYFLLTGNLMFLLIPAAVAGAFFGFGLLMYYFGQWGGGDAKLLAAMGFLIGNIPIGCGLFPTYLNYFLNVFLVGAAYIITYAFAMSIINKKISSAFFKSLKGDVKEFSIFTTVIIVSTFMISLFFWYTLGTYEIMIMAPIILMGISLYILWKFLKTVEEVGFRKKISTRNLKEGDMLGEDLPKLNLNSKIIRGLTKEEIKKIRKVRKTIWIREGVRFGPVFCIAAIVTFLYGNLVMFIL